MKLLLQFIVYLFFSKKKITGKPLNREKKVGMLINW